MFLHTFSNFSQDFRKKETMHKNTPQDVFVVKEKQITIIAVAAIILGLITLYFTLPQKFEAPEVKITGEVNSIDEKEKFTIISIKTKTPINAITFQKTSLNKGDKIELIGRLQQYRGKIEIVADKIIKK